MDCFWASAAVVAALCCCPAVEAVAQQAEISGTVKDGEGNPVEGAVVRAFDGKRMLGFAVTGSVGAYRIKLDTQAKTLRLTCAHLSFGKAERAAEPGSRAADFTLETTAKKLKEVTIRAPKIRLAGDTISYNLAAFAGKGDVTLEDAMKKLPGVDVADNGGIKYNGRDINNFYIEGMDLLGGRYALATRNLKADQVAGVDILQHHQAAKMDKNLHTNNVAINIRLSHKAKFKPVGNTEAAVGYGGRILYKAGASAMMFVPRFQAIATAKAGNDKSFADDEMYDFIEAQNQRRSAAEDAIGSLSASTPPLKGNRYVSPTDYMASLNTIAKVGKDATLKANADYSYSETEYGYSTESHYYALGKETTVAETMSPTTRKHYPKLTLDYTLDKDDKYVSERIYASGQFARNRLGTLSGGDQMTQQMQWTTANVRNDFSWRARTGRQDWNFGLTNHYTAAPSFSFAVQGGAGNPVQTAASTTLTNEAEASTRIFIGTSNIYLPLSVSFDYGRLGSRLGKDGQVYANRLLNTQWQPSFNPRYEYQSPDSRVNLSVGLPMRLVAATTHYGDGQKNNFRRFYADPSLSIDYALNAVSTLSLSSSLDHDIGDMLDFMTAPVMDTWRTTSAKSGIMSKQRAIETSLRYDYKQPLDMLFANASASYNITKLNTIASQDIDGANVASAIAAADNYQRSIAASASVTKTLQAIATKLSVSASYNRSTGETVRQGQKVEYTGQQLSFFLSANARPWGWAELDYYGQAGKDFSRFLGEKSSYISTSHTAKLSFFPIDRLQLGLSLDYMMREIADNRLKDIMLFDFSAQWKSKRCVLRLSADNLLDKRHYAYTIYSGVDRFSYDYALRGRQVMLSFTLFR